LDKQAFGPWAVVTGASSGIGRELARQIAANGINVLLVARRLRLLEEAAAEIQRAFGVEARVLVADLTDPGASAQIAEATRENDVGLVVSNAGTANPGELLKQDSGELLRMFRLNAQVHLELAHHFGARLLRRGRGGILLTGAMGATDAVPYVVGDSASKSFVETLGKGLNFELRSSGVHVTVLVVGPTQTAIIDKFGLDPATMPMRPMTTEQCAFEGLDALSRNRPTHINGRTNRLMTALIPAGLSRKIMKKMMEKGLATRALSPGAVR
jgi:short-subunit dehydrogenase